MCKEMEHMPQAKQRSTAPTNDGATVGYEAQLWQMADALRGSMDAAEYKHVVAPESAGEAAHHRPARG